MAYGLQQTVAPTVEPVTLAEIKAHVRQDLADDDAFLQSLAIAARRYVERMGDRQLVNATWKLTLDRFPRYAQSAVWQQSSDTVFDQRIPQTELSGRWWPDRSSIRLPRPPLQSVTSVQYLDGTGTLQTLSNTLYVVDAASEPGRIAPAYGQTWPIVQQTAGAVQVTFIAGFGALPSAVPETLKLAIKLLVGHWYENREDAQQGVISSIPRGVDALIMSEWDGEYT